MRLVLVNGSLLYQNRRTESGLTWGSFLDSATMSPRSDDSIDPDTDLKHENWKPRIISREWFGEAIWNNTPSFSKMEMWKAMLTSRMWEDWHQSKAGVGCPSAGIFDAATHEIINLSNSGWHNKVVLSRFTTISKILLLYLSFIFVLLSFTPKNLVPFFRNFLLLPHMDTLNRSRAYFPNPHFFAIDYTEQSKGLLYLFISLV